MTTLWRTLPLDHEYVQDEPAARELSLALAVVEQALKDIRSGSRRYKPEVRYNRNRSDGSRAAEANDARDFLLRRLWEPGCRWGDVLRSYGARPFDEMSLARAVRAVEERGSKKGGGALYGKVSRTVAAIV